MGKQQPGKILIGNIASDSNESSVRELFSQTNGRILSVDLPVNQQSGKCRGYALVQMSNQQDTDDAIVQLDGSDMSGRRVNVTLSEAEAPKSKRGLFLFNF